MLSFFKIKFVLNMLSILLSQKVLLKKKHFNVILTIKYLIVLGLLFKSYTLRQDLFSNMSGPQKTFLVNFAYRLIKFHILALNE